MAAVPLGRLPLMMSPIPLLARLLCGRLCRRLSRQLCRVEMPIELAHATATIDRPSAITVLTVTKTAMTYGLCRSNTLEMYAEQIVLSSNSTCRIRFHLRKETRGS